MATTILYRGYIGIMENSMETTVLYGVMNTWPSLKIGYP